MNKYRHILYNLSLLKSARNMKSNRKQRKTKHRQRPSPRNQIPVCVAGSLRANVRLEWLAELGAAARPTDNSCIEYMTKQALIIGAGPGGLASAILLAAAGMRVKIIERLPIIGGRTSRIEADGYDSISDRRSSFTRGCWRRSSRPPERAFGAEVEMVRLDPQYRIQFGAGGKLDCTPDIPRMERQIAALSPDDAPGFRRFLDENRTKLTLMEPCLESAFLGWQDLVQTRLFKMLPMLRPHQSVDTYLKRFFTDERVRLAFCFQSKYLGMSPFRCPSLFSILSLSGI